MIDWFQSLQIDRANLELSQTKATSRNNESHLETLEEKIDSLYIMTWRRSSY